MSNFEFKKLEIEGVILISPKTIGDDRGFFMESYKKAEFAQNGIEVEFIQDNHSSSAKGVLRGLHYQAKPYSQAKLLRCVRGKILDVVVDLRRSSKTFGKWLKVELSEENKSMIYVPEGLAHGFLVVSDIAEVLYKVNREYSPEHDRGVLYCDPEIGIDWGNDRDEHFEPKIVPILSEKDKNLPLLKDLNREELYE